MALTPEFKITTGTAEALEATPDAEILAAPGAGKRIILKKAWIMVTVAAAAAGGEVALEDGAGGTRFFEADADALGVYPIDFGEEGYPLSVNTALNLTVDGSAGDEATARCTAVGVVA